MEKETERMRVTRETLGAERTESFVDENVGNQDDMIETVDCDKLLPVPLTDRERLELGQNIARVYNSIGEEKDQAKADAEAHKASITEMEKGLGLDARTLRIGSVERMVKCQVIKDYRHGSVRIVRLDTGNTVDARPMTSEERQQGMKF